MKVLRYISSYRYSLFDLLLFTVLIRVPGVWVIPGFIFGVALSIYLHKRFGKAI